jgi:hypothetical protein
MYQLKKISKKILFVLVKIFEFILSRKIFLVFDNDGKNYKYKISHKEVPKIGIIIQGPIVKYTLETAKIYRSIYKEIIIIISTDTNLKKDQIEFLKKNRIKYLFNSPQIKSFQNLISQQLSTLNGLIYLRKKGVKLAIKTRADQRFLNPLFLKHLFYFHKFVDPKFSKISVTSYNSYKFRPFNLSDFFYFGKVSELIKLFNIDKKIKDKVSNNKFIELSNKKIFNANTLSEWNKISGAGSLLAFEYVKKKNKKIKVKFNLDHTQKFVFKHYIIIDRDILGLVWYKYNNFLNRDYPSMYGDNELFSNMTFSDWLEMGYAKKFKFKVNTKINLPWKKLN